jgi:hypothetical protein
MEILNEIDIVWCLAKHVTLGLARMNSLFKGVTKHPSQSQGQQCEVTQFVAEMRCWRMHSHQGI